jgi:hypothetical protein
MSHMFINLKTLIVCPLCSITCKYLRVIRDITSQDSERCGSATCCYTQTPYFSASRCCNWEPWVVPWSLMMLAAESGRPGGGSWTHTICNMEHELSTEHKGATVLWAYIPEVFSSDPGRALAILTCHSWFSFASPGMREQWLHCTMTAPSKLVSTHQPTCLQGYTTYILAAPKHCKQWAL